jgi:hypothetical protein
MRPGSRRRTTDYTLTDKDALVKSRVAPLKGRTLLKSLLALDSLNRCRFFFVWATREIDFPVMQPLQCTFVVDQIAVERRVTLATTAFSLL